ncbi:MAG TPA: hypothetical protein VN375_17940 [Vicinamibacteria bacterium]|jgi:hypothetical protein|nr:hypothetical protein [Vicinamibacteria bacterium]
MVRALSPKQAEMAGFKPWQYDYKAVPEGTWFAILDQKIWGSSKQPRVFPLRCFFSTPDGKKYQLTAFRTQDTREIYAPADGHLDVGSVPVGTLLRVVVGRNGKGNIKWLSAEVEANGLPL